MDSDLHSRLQVLADNLEIDKSALARQMIKAGVKKLEQRFARRKHK